MYFMSENKTWKCLELVFITDHISAI